MSEQVRSGLDEPVETPAGDRVVQGRARLRDDHRIHTQFFLKQSCEQKKLSLMPSLRHVGHCKDPASFSQSTPKHFFFAGGSEVMVLALEFVSRGKRFGSLV